MSMYTSNAKIATLHALMHSFKIRPTSNFCTFF